MNKRVLLICERESIFVTVVVEKLADMAIKSIVCPFDRDMINRNWNDAGLVTLFVDSGKAFDSGIAEFVSEKLIQTNRKMVLIGEKTFSAKMLFEISEKAIYKYFLKPLDNQAYVESVISYFNNQPVSESKKSILIVDDDPTYMGLVRDWLKDSYKVTMATSGMQAIKWLATNKADLILLDHEMPVVSGPQVLEMLRSERETAGIPVVFLTGKSDMNSVMEVVSLKPAGYILKSVEKHELLERLERFFLLNKFE